jgi:hypothetical protein
MELVVLLGFWFVLNMMNVQSPWLSIRGRKRKREKRERNAADVC